MPRFLPLSSPFSSLFAAFVAAPRLRVVNVVFLGVLTAFSLLSMGSSCSTDGSSERCTTVDDARCADGQICDVDEGYCTCNPDVPGNNGCSVDEICNAERRCQIRPGCLTNDDCENSSGEASAEQFCDVTTGTCLLKLYCQAGDDDVCCTKDTHCPYAHICNALEGRCILGCNDDGDCLLGQGCVKEAIGTIGQCQAGRCTANNQCGYGELCNLEDGFCVYDARGPICQGCSGGVASDDCEEPANYCLTDSSDPTRSSEFCGVDCSQGQPCPFGYSCSDVILFGQSLGLPACSGAETCVLDGPEDTMGYCSRNALEACSVDEDCPQGPPGNDCPRAHVGNCLLDQFQDCSEDVECCDDPDACPEGSCVKQVCRGGEGASFGTCTCTRDVDCPTDTCQGADLSDPENQITGHCALSGHTCYEDLDCDVIACIEGGCRIGSNCSPANDRSCRDLISR
ncbi:MAG: hypothetical protein GY822_28000 [Deltaproteobacteria bacterium]|nr:hypothetical protein [Deltaproteobacteria bacterium]